MAPVEILFSVLSGYLSSTKPFAFVYKMQIVCAFLVSYKYIASDSSLEYILNSDFVRILSL